MFSIAHTQKTYSETCSDVAHRNVLHFLYTEKAATEEPATTEETKEETVVIKEGDKVEADRVEADGDTQSGPVVPDGLWDLLKLTECAWQCNAKTVKLDCSELRIVELLGIEKENRVSIFYRRYWGRC